MSKIQVQDQMVDSCLLQDLPKPPIHNLWELDTIGIKEDSLTVGERHAVDFFTKSIQYDGDKYWVRLPWKRDPSEVSNELSYGCRPTKFSSDPPQ